MKKTIAMLMLLIALTQVCYASTKWVNGYFRRDGTYVQGHYKDTSADGNPWNNVKNNNFPKLAFD